VQGRDRRERTELPAGNHPWDLSNPGVNYSSAASFKNIPSKLDIKALKDSSPSAAECRNQEPSQLQKLVEAGPEAGPGMDQITLNKAMLRYQQ